MITCSLDCELIWGVIGKVDDQYISNNVAMADYSLSRILDLIEGDASKLALAYVVKSLPYTKCEDSNMQGYDDAIKVFTWKTVNKSIDKGVTLGLHSYKHSLYSDMSCEDYVSEVNKIKDFLSLQSGFSGFFVYPKNQMYQGDDSDIFQTFSLVRMNSNSWLYKSKGQSYNSFKRILRYLDSFIPIYELFCDKKPEYENDKSVVGTHFYRGNLKGWLLKIHYWRLLLGKKLMALQGKSMHLWSHPHNFGGNEESIKYFVKLGDLNGK